MSVGGLYHSGQLPVIAGEKNWTKTETIYSLIELMLTGREEERRGKTKVKTTGYLCIWKWLVVCGDLHQKMISSDPITLRLQFYSHWHWLLGAATWHLTRSVSLLSTMLGSMTVWLCWLCVCPRLYSLGLSAIYLWQQQIICKLAPDPCPMFYLPPPTPYSKVPKHLWF